MSGGDEGRRPRVESRSGLDREIDEEIRHHLEGRVEELMAAGLDRRAAEREARRRFGDPERVRRACRRAHDRARGRWSIPGLGPELAGAVRSLIRHPAHAGLVVLLLAVGIGVSAGMLSVIDAYLLRDMPFPGADRLHWVARDAPGPGDPAEAPGPVDWDRLPAVVEAAVSWELDVFTLVGGDRPEQVSGAWVSPEFFRAFGVEPAMGRVVAEGPEARAPVALIGHALWQRRFAGDPEVVGRTVRMFPHDLPGQASELTIVGVLPPDFWFVNEYTEILVPLEVDNPAYVVRLAPGVDAATAAERMTALARSSWGPEHRGWHVRLDGFHERHVRGVRPTLTALASAVTLVLLVACANVAILLVLRAAGRRREFATRQALGAGTGRLATRLLCEAGVLGVLGTGLGLLAAAWSLAALAPAIEQQLETAVPGGSVALQLDPRTAGMAAAVGLLCSMAFGLSPLLSGLRSPAEVLAAAGRGATGGRRHGRVRDALVVAELAVSLALLVAAGLMVRSAAHLAGLDPGFEPRGLLQAGVNLSTARYPEPVDRHGRFREILEATRRVPGITAAAAVYPPPLTPWGGEEVEVLDGDHGSQVRATVRAATPGILETLEVPLLRGRALRGGDTPGGDRVALVSADFASRAWGEAALGSHVRVPTMTSRMSGEAAAWHRVVGIVGEVAEDPAAEQRPDVYLPLGQYAPTYAYLMVRGTAPPERLVPLVEEAVWEGDPEQPLVGPVGMASVARQAVAGPRLLAGLLAGFAAFAGLLAVVGVYGVISFAARSRRREIALRMALGAPAGDVRRLLMARGARLVGAGLALGLGGAWLLSRTLASEVHGVGVGDPLTYAVVAALLGAASLAAVLVPSARASRTDPMAVLRQE